MDFLIPSRRTRSGDDPIFTLHAEATARAKAGEDIVNATIGVLLHDDGRLAIMPTVVEVLRKVEPELGAAYAPIAGRPEFRSAVVRDLLPGLADVSIGIATPGGSGALRMALDNFLEPHQTVLTSSYFWGPYRTLSDEADRSFTTFRMFDDAGRFDVLDLERKLDAILSEQGRALVFINSPCHNPTGYSLDQREWDATVEVLTRLAPRGPIAVLLDAAYGYYQKAGLDVALASLSRVVDDVMVLVAWSASKSFTQYGLRVGALVAVVPDAAQRSRIDNALTYSCRGTFSNCNAGGQAAIARLLSDSELNQRASAERAELVSMLAERVALWNNLAKGTSIRYPRYDGGFFTTVFHDDPQAVAARLRERGIFVVPLAGALRVALCAVNEAQIQRIVAAFAAVLE
jgi:aromatic-amino-acid transaminase